MVVLGQHTTATVHETTSRELLRAYHDRGDLRARERLITMHLPFVRGLARRFTNAGEELEDLTQVGALGLIKAIDRFDARRGVAFATYARPTVVGEIQRHLRDRASAVSAPRSLQERSRLLRRLRVDLAARLGRVPSLGELAEEAGASTVDVAEALELERAQRPLSLDPESAAELRVLAPEDAYGASEDRMLLASSFRALPARERRILHLRFYAGLSQDAIAAAVGLSQIHVSRLLSHALATLYDQLSEPYTDSGGSCGAQETGGGAAREVAREPQRAPALAHAARAPR
jgi:RNA polymerase sigma-B factor